jgi:ankyrin repeat protein
MVLNRAVASGRHDLAARSITEGADPNVGFEPAVAASDIALVQMFMLVPPDNASVVALVPRPVQYLAYLESDFGPDASLRQLDRAPLLVATWNDDIEMVRLLLEAGADPNAQSSGGYTALHVAAVAKRAAIEDLLVEAGAVAPEGVITPAELAARSTVIAATTTSAISATPPGAQP